MKVISTLKAQKNLHEIINQVITQHQPVEISTSESEGVIVICKSDWNAIKETMYLQNAGVLEKIMNSEDEKAEDLGVIDWDRL